ncbi:MAG TPA: iron-sulfur cluster assembly accessory protein [Candidatus Thalassarchaeaceae archaeon]|nr:iron-sulfur cluster assembly accessory protein [Candidatus Thalassarchaeaceae archaeon]
MGLIDGDSFALPMAVEVDVVDADIDVTEHAVNAMKQAIGDDVSSHVLLISVEAGGCSGHMYDMQIIPRPDDSSLFQSFDVSGITVMVHNKDSTTLNGIRIDYKDTLLGGGFQIDNPNADKSCGCGQSFG